MKKLKIILPFLFILFITSGKAYAQFLMDMVDTTKTEGKGILGVYKKFDHLKIGGYIQPQFQIASQKGIKSYEGGDFGQQVSNRFMLRRSRIRIEYAHFSAKNGPDVQIVFQFDANERSFTVRDVWGRVLENRYKLFSFTTGIFARPFSYEVNYSSSDRESPERGRMSQILMKSERDLGAMISLESRRDVGFFKKMKIDLGLFDGQGINASGDFDNAKDLISRISFKPISLSKNIRLSLGASTLQGALLQNTKYEYYTGTVNGIKTTLVDSSASNLHQFAPRKYYGADAQLKIKNNVGFSEFKAELMNGQQSATESSSETPVALLTGTNGFYTRQFNGAYFYYIQSLFSTKHQLVFKYDWYDPNTYVTGMDIGAAGSKLSSADIKYSTLGVGYINYLTENVKIVIYYAHIRNEMTQLAGYTSDLNDDVMTLRLQFRF